MEALIPGLPDDLAQECFIWVAYDHLFIIDSVCRRWRNTVRSPYFHFRRRLAGVTRRILGVIQKVPKRYNNNIPSDECETSLTLFNPVSGTWRSLPPIPDLPNLYRERVYIVGVGGLLLAIGRHHGSSVSIYDCLTSAWREGASIPGEQRVGFTCVSDGIEKVYVAGGYGPQSETRIRSVMCYDVEEDRWETVDPDMADGGWIYRGAFQTGKLYLMKENFESLNLRYLTNVYDVSSHESYVVGTAEQMKLEYWDNTYECAFALDGKIFCGQKGGKLKVREDEKWRELGDLPYDINIICNFSCWDGGVIIFSLDRDDFSLPSDRARWITSYNMYTFMLQDQNLSWTLHEMPKKGWIDFLTWLDI